MIVQLLLRKNQVNIFPLAAILGDQKRAEATGFKHSDLDVVFRKGGDK